MSIEIKVEPYISVGKCVFGMTRNELAKMLGVVLSISLDTFYSNKNYATRKI